MALTETHFPTFSNVGRITLCRWSGKGVAERVKVVKLNKVVKREEGESREGERGEVPCTLGRRMHRGRTSTVGSPLRLPLE